MVLEVLISCMHQEDMAIAAASGITTDALIINQCDRNDYQETSGKHTIRMISTTERGLSNSRNMAIEHAVGDICLFCDNDEEFYHDYEPIIRAAFQRLPDADIILFSFDNLPHEFAGGERRLKYKDLFHAMSCQIAYRNATLKRTSVRFHPFMGAGTGNGAQEENKFLMDCYKKGMKIYYVPQKLGRLLDNESTWFDGYDEKFFYQRGGSTRQMLGLPLSVLYAIYYVGRKKSMYSRDISPAKALRATLRGCFEDPIGKQMRKQRQKHK